MIKLKITVNARQTFSFEFLIRDSLRVPLLFLPVGLAHGKEHVLECGTYDVTITTILPY
jgi:hypothetical protein